MTLPLFDRDAIGNDRIRQRAACKASAASPTMLIGFEEKSNPTMHFGDVQVSRRLYKKLAASRSVAHAAKAGVRGLRFHGSAILGRFHSRGREQPLMPAR